jgi:hypothetical protein
MAKPAPRPPHLLDLARPLDLKAPVGTYRVDHLVPADEVTEVRRALNRAVNCMRIDDYTVGRYNRYKRCKPLVKEARRLFVRVAKFRDRLNAIGDSMMAGGDDVVWMAMSREDRITQMQAACNNFLNDLFADDIYTSPLDKWLTTTYGNHDWPVWIFIDEMAKSSLDPITRDNYLRFAELLAAGWQDLGLPLKPRINRPNLKRGYGNIAQWMKDRVRHQLDFRPPPKRKGRKARKQQASVQSEA